MTEAPYDVFISHSSRNADLASAMKEYLEARGIRCWKAPEDIPPSEFWSTAIMRGLKECQIVVLIWTKESAASRQVLKEVLIADGEDKVFIPFRAEEILPEGDLEYFLRAKQWLDAHPSYEPALEKLAETALRVLGRNAVATAIPSPPSVISQPLQEQVIDPPQPASNAAATPTPQSTDSITPDQSKFLSSLSNFDAFAGDSELQEKLRWSDKKFEKIKQELADLDRVIVGSGRGGASAVTTPKLRQLKQELVNDSLPGSIFVNIGEAKEEGLTTRDWSLCKDYGFISAGHGARYANDMKRIKPGAIIFAYSSGAGYVGMGTALEAAVPITQFLVDGIPLQNQVPENPLFFHHLDDPEMCEWLVRVKWDKVLERDQAIYRTGLFVYVATSCRIKDAITVQYLRREFNSFLETPTLTDADRVE